MVFSLSIFSFIFTFHVIFSSSFLHHFSSRKNMSVPSISVDVSGDPQTQEETYVHTVYNEIASHFSQTRYKPWPIVEKFLNSRPDYSVGIDVGCGNGKYLGVNKKLFMIGTDRSDGLLYCGKDLSHNQYNLGVADGLSLPHTDNSLDFAISIAVIHHFSTPQRRIDAIAHILSKLRKDGELLVYCWALEQENSRRGYKEGDDQDILIPWVLQKKTPKKPKVHKKQKGANTKQSNTEQSVNTEQSTNIEPVKEDSVKEESVNPEPVTKYRYYHLYKKGELRENAMDTGMCEVVDEGYEKDNWWIIVRRK